MNRLPGALFIIDPRREIIAVREANKMQIPVVAFIDTDSDPELVTIPIPGNDDAMRAVQVITRIITDAVIEGHTGKPVKKAAPKKAPKATSEEVAQSEEPVAAKE
jgi:small subunit ribosomal protein S2